MMAVMGADVVMGHDRNCGQWIKAARNRPEPVAQTVRLEAVPSTDSVAVISRRRMRKLRQEASA